MRNELTAADVLQFTGPELNLPCQEYVMNLRRKATLLSGILPTKNSARAGVSSFNRGSIIHLNLSHTGSQKWFMGHETK